MDRHGLADFLRKRRERLQPSDVGLAAGVRRRTPGLRRDEVAALATMSTDYYTRLEQARGPHPSTSLLASLARALRMSDDERDHLFHLAGHPAPSRTMARQVSPGLLYLLDRLTDTVAIVVSDIGEVLAQNRLADLLFGERQGRNATADFFLDPGSRTMPPQDFLMHARAHVADLRATHGRRRGDADVEGLVQRLLDGSREFAQLWSEHEVGVRRADRKRFEHHEVGLVELSCEVMTSEVGGQTLVVLFPLPGDTSREQLDLLRVIGTQSFTTS